MSATKKDLKACLNCRYLVPNDVEVCPNCGSKRFTDEWEGFVIIIDPEKSSVAKSLGISKPGKYAIKIR
jgi:DNA-directed RNA polymerase subunit E"|uniref:Transcription elongation factor Spt4 n=1 Tax=Fervidicoccus fontis TaxID=683846 RepID=A0A7C1IHP7_9CREN